jgi:putative aminopeptidase FrvX
MIMSLPIIEPEFLLSFLSGLLNTPSPTGLAEPAIDFTEQALKSIPELSLTHTRKGALVATWQGMRSDAPRALTAHVDTLGAMVKQIKPNGRLLMSKIGGYAWNTVEGEGCAVHTSTGGKVRGSILFSMASSHVYNGKVNEIKREDENMEVRLDARTASVEQTQGLGIQVGDFISFDPRLEISNGFVRSRHLDDKACVACLIAAIQTIHQAHLAPTQTTHILISNYEEVGHGAAAGIPAQVTELISVDMAAVGEGQASDEFHATLCVKDSGGPYHHGLSQKLRQLADAHGIPYHVDIYPHYGSDGEAFWHSGGDAAVALIGPGVDASHNYERTHLDALMGTTQWVIAYLLS